MLTKTRFESASKLFSYCTELYKQKKAPPLNAFVVFPVGDSTPESISEAAKKRRLTFEIQKTGKNIYLTRIGVRRRIVKFHLVANRGWWLFLGDEKTQVLRDVFLDSFIGNHLSWALEPGHLETNQLTKILDDLALKYDRVNVTGCRYYQPGVTKLEFRQRGFQISYHAGLLKELEDDSNGTLSAIKIEFADPDSLQNRVRILTRSQMTYYGGYFMDFYQSVIIPYAEEAQNTRKRFSNRERRIEPHRVVFSPTRIKCSEAFNSDQIEQLQKVLVSHYSTSISYCNPVMIAHVTDRKDGSSFDIYLKSDSIQVVPLNRATSGGFTQLFALLTRYSPQIVDITDESYPTLS